MLADTNNLSFNSSFSFLFQNILWIIICQSIIIFDSHLYSVLNYLVAMADQLIPVKLVVVGDGYVGKTSLLLSYIKEEFRDDYQPTIFDNHSVIVKSGKKKVRLGLWDTAGQEEYSSLRPLAYSNCDLFLIVFSVVERASFQNAKNKWSKQIQKCAPGVFKIFIGNKTDLRNPTNPDHITYEAATKQLNSKMNAPYLECSALTRKGLEEVFSESIKLVLEKKKIIEKKSSDSCCHIF